MKVISLGFNCMPAMLRKKLFNQSKINGYLTCPFDLCVTPMSGLCDCIENDFDEFFCLRNETGGIMNKYNMWFNHESPVNNNLFKHLGNENYFIQNDHAEFKKRYMNRIENFKGYINGGDNILFIVSNPCDDVKRLNDILSLKYPYLNYQIAVINDPEYNDGIFCAHFGIDKSSAHNANYHIVDDSRVKYFDKDNIDGIMLMNF